MHAMPAMVALEDPRHRGPGEPLVYAPRIFLPGFTRLAEALGDHQDLRLWEIAPAGYA
jgi:hypothetical protein